MVSVCISCASFITSLVVAAVYLVLIAAAALGLSGKYHATRATPLLKQLFICWIVNGALRLPYFAVPLEVWTQTDHDAAAAAAAAARTWSTVWWLTFARLFLLVVPNWFLCYGYTIILRMWCAVHCIVSGETRLWPLRLMSVALSLYGLWQLAVLVVYFVSPLQVVMYMQDAANALFSVILAAVFLLYWRQLFSDLRSVMHAVALYGPIMPMAATTHTNGRSTTLSFSWSEKQPLRNADTLSSSDPAADILLRRTRDKLLRVSLVCAVCLVCTCLRAAMDLYLLAVRRRTASSAFEANRDSAATFIYFLVAEALALLMIFVLRRPTAPGLAAPSPALGAHSSTIAPPSPLIKPLV
ncbi:hypothetical protein EON66_05045 [archaeon]|nr:MAG: hypothetical protein EON66_05045 [archaeon]